VFNQGKFEAITGLWCPLDVLGCTRATLIQSTSTKGLGWKVTLIFYEVGILGKLLKLYRAGDRYLQLFIVNEEFLVSTSQQLVLITSLPFVHTARRCYWWLVRWNLRIRNSYLLISVNKFVFENLSKPCQLKEAKVVTRYP